MSKGSGTTRGYFVEARLHNGLSDFLIDGPPKVGHTWITESWKRISYSHVHPTIGVKNDIGPGAERSGLLTYAAAKALMAWVGSHHRRIEFRLVKAKCVWSYEVTEEGVSEPEHFGYFADRDIEFAATNGGEETDDE